MLLYKKYNYNKHVNQELRTLPKWLNAIKFCLNISKTEVVFF